MERDVEYAKLHARLQKIIGQVQAVDRLLQEGEKGEKVLSLVHAAKSALSNCGALILRKTIHDSVAFLADGDACASALDSIDKAVDGFAKID